MNISQKVVLSSIGSFIYNNGDWNDEFEKYADDYYGTEYNKAIERLPSDFREIYSNSEPENFRDWHLGDFQILPNRDVFMMIYNQAPEADGMELRFHDVHPLTVLYGQDYLPTLKDKQPTSILYFLFERVPKTKSRLNLTALLSVSMAISFSFRKVTYKKIGRTPENSSLESR